MFHNTAQQPKLGVCEVCRKLDGDSSAKQVEWCASCRADICDRCRNDWTRRLKAAAMKGLGYSRAV
jgi:uncharacterized CHY-type Zn-finger protein